MRFRIILLTVMILFSAQVIAGECFDVRELISCSSFLDVKSCNQVVSSLHKIIDVKCEGELKMYYNLEDLRCGDGPELMAGFYNYSSNKWEYLESFIDIKEKTVTTFPDKEGTYAVISQVECSRLAAEICPRITNPNEVFVYRLYKTLLNRNPDCEGFKNWVEFLNTQPQEEVFNSFAGSPEALEHTIEEYVANLYRIILDREPEPAGYENWLNAIKAGTVTKWQAYDGFVNSAEYQGNSALHTEAGEYCAPGVCLTTTPTPSDETCTPNQFDPEKCRRCAGDGTWHPDCTDYGRPGVDASLQQWCACELKCTGKNVNPDCVTEEPPGTCIEDLSCDYYFLFVPVDGWTSQKNFNQKSNERATFFIDISKFKSRKVGIIPLPISSECNSLAPVALSPKDPAPAALVEFFRSTRRCANGYANSLGIDYEKRVSLSPKFHSELGKIGVANGFYGYSAYAAVGWSGNPSAGIPIVAHELGHLYGLCEEYSYESWELNDKEQKRNWGRGCPNAWPTNCPKDESCYGNSNIYRAYSGQPLPGVECSTSCVVKGKAIARHCVMGNSGGSPCACGYDNTGGYDAVG